MKYYKNKNAFYIFTHSYKFYSIVNIQGYFYISTHIVMYATIKAESDR